MVLIFAGVKGTISVAEGAGVGVAVAMLVSGLTAGVSDGVELAGVVVVDVFVASTSDMAEGCKTLGGVVSVPAGAVMVGTVAEGCAGPFFPTNLFPL